MSTHLSTTPAKKSVDTMPFDRASIASLTPAERSAIYLNQIRKMMIFFVVLAAVGLVAGIIIGIVDINTLSSSQSSTIGTGF